MNIHVAEASPAPLATLDILGTRVACIGWNAAIAYLSRLVAERRFTPVGFLNAHNANVACRDREFAQALDRFLILPDGIGVDIAAKVLHGRAFPANLNGTDFLPALIEACPSPITVGLIGATRRNAEAAKWEFARRCPQQNFIVIHDGYFRPQDEAAILERVRAIRPTILLVAMGVPRQELWIARNITPEHCTLPIAVGALLDFMSGAVPRAPASWRRLRLEWLFRLMIEPRRLWRRYVIGNPLFLARLLRRKLSGAVPVRG